MSARRFKPYPAYKDSGVGWLGEIPAHWEAKPAPDGDFFVRSGPGIVKLSPDSAREYIRTRFRGFTREGAPAASSDEAV